MQFEHEFNHKTGGTGIRPLFEMRAIPNPRKSREQGRPIFDELEYVMIYIVGDKNTVASERVKDEHRKRWPNEYAAFKAGRQQSSSGTPIEQWPALGISQVAEFKALHIHTVEDLAALTDAGIGKIGVGGRTWVERAKAFLEAASGGAPADRLQHENDQLRAQLDAMERKFADLSARVEERLGDDAPAVSGSLIGESERRGPGRPRKVS